MRVYVPDPRDEIIRDALSQLYLLKQAINHQTGGSDSRIKMVDAIRTKLLTLVDSKEE